MANEQGVQEGSREDLISVLLQPSRAMVYARERKSMILLYVVTSLLLGLIAMYTSTATVALQRQSAWQMMADRGASEADIAQYLQNLASFGRLSAVAQAVALPWLAGLFGASSMALAGAVLNGSRPFGQYFRLYGYALIPGLAGRALELVLRSRVTHMAAMADISLSAASVIPGLTPGSVLHILAAAIHPTALASLYLGALGFAALHGVKLRKAAVLAAMLGGLLLLSTAMQMAGLSAGR